jgi:hypothetical protein
MNVCIDLRSKTTENLRPKSDRVKAMLKKMIVQLFVKGGPFAVFRGLNIGIYMSVLGRVIFSFFCPNRRCKE